eukprot:4603365-Pleurochrysis_carterae.AAC.2
MRQKNRGTHPHSGWRVAPRAQYIFANLKGEERSVLWPRTPGEVTRVSGSTKWFRAPTCRSTAQASAASTLTARTRHRISQRQRAASFLPCANAASSSIASASMASRVRDAQAWKPRHTRF